MLLPRSMEDDDIRDMLEQAAYFVRAGDPRAAVVRARQAVMAATSPEAKDAAGIELERMLAAERAWTAALIGRWEQHRTIEVGEAQVDEAIERNRDLYEPGAIRRLFGRVRDHLAHRHHAAA